MWDAVMDEPKRKRSLREMQEESRMADAEAGFEPKGIPCPNCGSTERRVWKTKPQPNIIARRICCQNCPHRFTTYEHL